MTSAQVILWTYKNLQEWPDYDNDCPVKEPIGWKWYKLGHEWCLVETKGTGIVTYADYHYFSPPTIKKDRQIMILKGITAFLLATLGSFIFGG